MQGPSRLPSLRRCGAPPDDRREEPRPEHVRGGNLWLGYRDPEAVRHQRRAWQEAMAGKPCPGVDHSRSECRMARLGRGTGDPERMAAEDRAFYTEGLYTPRLDSDYTVVDEGELRITTVPPDAPLEQCRRAEWICERARREMPYDRSPYPESLDERRQRHVHAFLAHISDHLLGVVLMSCRNRVVTGAWVGEDRCMRPERVYVTAQGWWTVAFAWTYQKQRGRGLVPRMLQEIATLTGAASPASFAWEPPFSPGGRRLIDHFSPDPLILFLSREVDLSCEEAERLANTTGGEL